MMRTEQLERAAGIAANVAYCLVVLSLLIALFPGLRRPLQRAATRLVYDYRHGVWLAKQPRKAPVPAWVPRAFKGEPALPPE